LTFEFFALSLRPISSKVLVLEAKVLVLVLDSQLSQVLVLVLDSQVLVLVLVLEAKVLVLEAKVLVLVLVTVSLLKFLSWS